VRVLSEIFQLPSSIVRNNVRVVLVQTYDTGTT